MRIVIVGATSQIAEQIARRWVANVPCDVTLIVRDASRGQQIAEDLKVRSPDSTFRVLTTDFVSAPAIAALADKLATQAPIDLALIAHGSLPDQEAAQADLTLCAATLQVNGVSPVLFAEGFARHMERRGSGTIVLIGSVAGDRGRKANYIYGAAKGMVERYAQGMQHRFAKSAVRIVLAKPGPTDTPMTSAMKQSGGRLADAGDVAALIVAASASGQAVVYAPRKWRLIMLVIRHLPRALFNRLNI